MLSPTIKTIEFDITSSCQASCLNCFRGIAHDNVFYRNNMMKYDTHLSLDGMEKVMSYKNMDPQVEIQFIGLAGDPCSHPNFIEMIKIARRLVPNCFIIIHTNGGMREPEWWKELAHALDNSYGERRLTLRPHHVREHQCVFSIDGLQDTNHIYRRNVIWEKVMENAKAYINEKVARAQWKFIKFPWNKHQVKEARKLAQLMGFDAFDVRNNREDFKTTYKNKRAADNLITKRPAPTDGLKPWEFDYTDRVIDMENKDCNISHINVNFEGLINPCCYLSSTKWSYTEQDMRIKYMDPDESNWNSLYNHDLEEILNNPWMVNLYDTFETNPNQLCLHKCGKQCH